MNDMEMRGAWVRSSIEHFENNEKSNANFFGQAKETHDGKTMSKMEIGDQDIVESTNISNECIKLYEQT